MKAKRHGDTRHADKVEAYGIDAQIAPQFYAYDVQMLKRVIEAQGYIVDVFADDAPDWRDIPNITGYLYACARPDRSSEDAQITRLRNYFNDPF